jgi:hypothetical protein
MAKNIIELFNSIAVFLCLLVFRARSIKQKSITLKIKKNCFAIWIFCAMPGYEFHFFMTTLKFLQINMGKLFPVPFENAKSWFILT